MRNFDYEGTRDREDRGMAEVLRREIKRDLSTKVEQGSLGHRSKQ